MLDFNPNNSQINFKWVLGVVKIRFTSPATPSPALRQLDVGVDHKGGEPIARI
jgi:hypothetical protein